MRYLFGPVRSRRLGRSLGIDLVPGRLCTMDCVYCEIGRKKALTCRRGEYAPLDAILAEVDLFLARHGHDSLDVFTITGSGEPTLHTGLGRLVAALKERSTHRVCLLTNGSLFHLPEVRQAVREVDVIIPSLDAARPDSFRAVNRPAAGLDPATIIAGLEALAGEFTGEIWLEILLVKGINDSDADLAALRRAIDRIRPHRIQLNTVVRPPLEADARPLSEAEMQAAAAALGPGVEIIGHAPPAAAGGGEGVEDEDLVLATLRRRPCPREELGQILGLAPERLDALLADLRDRGRVRVTRHNGVEYFRAAGGTENTNEKQPS